MLQSTIGDLLAGKLNDLNTTDHNLYVVRDGDTVFYVGKSQEVVDRLKGHMGGGQWGHWGKSYLGRIIEHNIPESIGWQIELWTPGECGVEPHMLPGITKEDWEKTHNYSEASLKYFTPIPWDESMEQGIPYYNDAMIAQAEELLIANLHPCLNVSLNRDPSALPERYQIMPDLEVTASDFIPW